MEKLNDKMRAVMEKVMLFAAGGVLVSYLGFIILFIVGMTANLATDVMLTFTALSGAVVTLAVTLFRAQGQRDASMLEPNKVITDEWIAISNTKVEKEKKLRTIEYYMIVNTLKDIAFKGLGIVGMTYGVIHVAVNGNGEWGLVLPALGNICLAVALGLKSYVNTYDFYNKEHIAAIRERIRRSKEREANENK